MSQAVKTKLENFNLVNLAKSKLIANKQPEVKLEEFDQSQSKMMKSNPLNIFGVGIVAQFNLMEYLIVAFFVFTLLSIPIIMIYNGYDAMRGTKKEMYTKSTLGNFGFSSTA